VYGATTQQGSNLASRPQVKLASPGSVAFNFDKRGQIILGSIMEEDILLEAAIEAGVEEVDITVRMILIQSVVGIGGDSEVFTLDMRQVDDEEGVSTILVDPGSVAALRDQFGLSGVVCKATRLVNVPKLTVDCSDEDFENNLRVIEALEAIDDVDSVEHNMGDEE
jgi:transcriptional/translational regulatory protein YebC/TACO1